MEWTKDLSIRLRSLHSQRLTTPEIAKRMNLPELDIKDKLFALGLAEHKSDTPKPSEFATTQKIPQKSAPKTEWTDERITALIKMYQQGDNASAIAAALRLDYKAVYFKIKHLKETGKLVEKLMAEAVSAPEPVPVPCVPAPTLHVPDSIIKMAEARKSHLEKRAYAVLAEIKELSKFLDGIKNEPAPAATDTSSSANISPKV